ncbi:MAG TPA: hypothetical protein VHB20_15720 [Verrucomicrobiae bacterium]|jgi:hypothetical protein|nr:hypothetical protein [Verrucomicrobiae bacterium]
MLCALAALLLIAAGQMQRLLNAERDQLGFVHVQPLQNAPPILAFTTVALGGFRGLIANALWIRTSELQEDNKYFEMVQLADWITKLQPHMVQVWLVQAWNMAYNVSVKFKNPEDRWLWVQRGISLLRDEGLRYNPNQSLMYRELSWIFQHKVGANLDDAHMTYKLHWAQQMQQIFPDGRPNTNELAHPTDALWRERSQKLRDVYKMDPAIIARVDQEYGPLDWRLPGAQAVYWAEMGRIYADAKDQETLRRSVFQTMRLTCFIGGGITPGVTNVTPDNFFLRPNLELIPTISSTYEKLIAEEKDPNQTISFKTAHKNFLKEAIPLLYVDAEETKAAYWFKYLKQNYTNSFAPGETLDSYVFKTLTEDTGETDMNKVMSALLGLAHREYLCLIFQEYDKVQKLHALTQKIWDHYNVQIKSSEQRLRIPDLKSIRQFVLSQMLDPEGPFPYYLSPINRASLRKELGLPVEGTVAAPEHAYGTETNSVPGPQAAH